MLLQLFSALTCNILILPKAETPPPIISEDIPNRIPSAFEITEVNQLTKPTKVTKEEINTYPPSLTSLLALMVLFSLHK